MTAVIAPELGREAVALAEKDVDCGAPRSSVVGVTELLETAAILAARKRGVDPLPMFDRIGAQTGDKLARPRCCRDRSRSIGGS